MLLETKIQDILTNKNNLYESRLTVLDSKLKLTPGVSTKNFIVIDILFYLLEQGFTQDYINLQLYKYLNYMLNITEPIELSHPLTTTTSVPTITISGNSLDFGDIIINQESTSQSITIVGSNLTNPVIVSTPVPFKTSSNQTTNYTNGNIFFPVNGSINITLFIKFLPTSVTVYSEDIEVSSTDFITQAITCAGEGIAEP